MCGLVGLAYKDALQNTLYESLIKLEYRGYDSFGFAYKEKDRINVYKKVGAISKSFSNLPSISSNVGISHTRWATHGEVSINNTHPFVSSSKKFYLAHNGIITNYEELKKELSFYGYKFSSSTDSEVIVQYLDHLYSSNSSMLESLRILSNRLKGQFAIVILTKLNDNIYFLKDKTPLVIGKTRLGMAIVSDTYAISSFGNEFYDLKDGEYGFINSKSIYVLKNGRKIEPSFYLQDEDKCSIENNNKTFFEKEIQETPLKLKEMYSKYLEDTKLSIDIRIKQIISNSSRIVFVGCGSSFHACEIAGYYYSSIKNTKTYLASEFIEENTITPGDVYILISQSGETQDVIKCLKYLKNYNQIVISLTNNIHSSIAKESTFSLPLYMGKEISVASTKAFIGEVSLLLLLLDKYNEELILLPDYLFNIYQNREKIKNIALKISKFQNAYFLGRGKDFLAAKEASLKLKEVTYIHSESVHIGELKHGPIAIENENFLNVIISSSSENNKKNEISKKEVESRRGVVLSLFEYLEDKEYLFNEIISIYLVQIISLYIAIEKGLDVDKPKNLAKSVTVE